MKPKAKQPSAKKPLNDNQPADIRDQEEERVFVLSNN